MTDKSDRFAALIARLDADGSIYSQEQALRLTAWRDEAELVQIEREAAIRAHEVAQATNEAHLAHTLRASASLDTERQSAAEYRAALLDVYRAGFADVAEALRTRPTGGGEATR